MVTQPNAGDSSSRSRESVIAYIALASIVSAIGGLLKLPSPVGSVALDAVPGLFSAVYYNPFVGGLIGCIGHVLSAASAGFPLGLVHIVIAIGVGFVCIVFGSIARYINRTWGLLPAAVVAVVLNNCIPFVSAAMGLQPIESAYAIVFPFLIIAASVNVAFSCSILLAIRYLKLPGI